MDQSIKQNILRERSGHDLIIRFNRPEIRNPLSLKVLEELYGIIYNAGFQDDIKRIIFTGSGSIFASGANLNEIAKVTSDIAPGFAFCGQKLTYAIDATRHETIAAVNGHCFGGALDLALACDKRIASPNAVFCHPGVGLGIMTGWGGTQRLPRLIGEAKALEMFLTAKRVDAEEALRIGLIDRITDQLTDGLADL